MSKELISIIIPVYNVEKYMKKCIESILSQTYENLEIIIVDDGSTDNSGKICDEYKEKDDRIKVMHQENKGLSGARNSGLEGANGKFICFVDSDDWVEKDYIDILYSNMRKNDCDISCCGYVKYYENNNKYVNSNFKNISKIYDKVEAQIYLNVQGYFDVGVWNKMFKKEMFENISFPVGKTCEDYRIIYRIFDKAKKIFYDSTPKYIYRQRFGSITKTGKIRMDGIEAAISAYNFYKKNDKYQKVIPYVAQSIIIQCIGQVNVMIKSDNFENYNYIYSIVEEYKKEFTYKKIKLYKKIQLFLFVHFKKIYIYFFKMLKK